MMRPRNHTRLPQPLRLAVLLCVLTAAFGIAQNTPQLQAPPIPAPEPPKIIPYPAMQTKAFAPGEQLTYKLKYSLMFAITAGEATFAVDTALVQRDGKKLFHFFGVGKSASTFEWFFKALYRHDTYAEAATLRPTGYTHMRREGKYKFDDAVTYDGNENIIKGVKGKFEIKEPTYDILTAIYYARCLDVRKGEVNKFYAIPTFYEDGIYQLGVRMVGREKVHVPAGTFNCIKIQPRVIAGDIFKDDSKMTIYVTDDDNYIPVRIESPIVVGSVRADLYSYNGVRNALTARIK